MKVSLYAAFHEASPTIDTPSVVPIQVGRALIGQDLPGMIGDETGDNISEKNRSYCELTALYWAWKNDLSSDYLGLMHYRRTLDVAGTVEGPMVEHTVEVFDTKAWAERTEAWMSEHLGEYDVILPKAHDIGLNVEDNYRKGHAPYDWDVTRQIIASKHPDYLDDFDAYAAGHKLALGNIFLMKRAIFEPFCAWLFDILSALEETDLDRTGYSPTQLRYVGHIAERLLGVYMMKLRRDVPDLRVREVHIINSTHSVVFPFEAGDRFNDPTCVNIAFSSDRAYLPHAAAMLHSVVSHASTDRTYNLFFLHENISQNDRALLASVLAPHAHFTLHEINTGLIFKSSYRSQTRAPSNTTYNRFLLFELLPGLDRLLYLDVDLILLGDVSEVFDSDIGDAQIGAVTDHIMTRTLSGKTPTADASVPDLYRYQRDQLGLSDDHIRTYFNAGVLLLHLEAMDVALVGKALFERARTSKYLFRDQDILNSYFKDAHFMLPDRFNVLNTTRDGYGRVPHENYARAMSAKTNPLIVHFAAADFKPWLGRAVPFAEHYWRAVRETPFYPEVLAALPRGIHARQPAPPNNGLVELGKRIAMRYPVLKPLFLKVYARFFRR